MLSSAALLRSPGPKTTYVSHSGPQAHGEEGPTHGSLLLVACCHAAPCPRPASTLGTKAWSPRPAGRSGCGQPDQQAPAPGVTATRQRGVLGGPGGEGGREANPGCPWGGGPRPQDRSSWRRASGESPLSQHPRGWRETRAPCPAVPTRPGERVGPAVRDPAWGAGPVASRLCDSGLSEPRFSQRRVNTHRPHRQGHGRPAAALCQHQNSAGTCWL